MNDIPRRRIIKIIIIKKNIQITFMLIYHKQNHAFIFTTHMIHCSLTLEYILNKVLLTNASIPHSIRAPPVIHKIVSVSWFTIRVGFFLLIMFLSYEFRVLRQCLLNNFRLSSEDCFIFISKFIDSFVFIVVMISDHK